MPGSSMYHGAVAVAAACSTASCTLSHQRTCAVQVIGRNCRFLQGPETERQKVGLGQQQHARQQPLISSSHSEGRLAYRMQFDGQQHLHYAPKHANCTSLDLMLQSLAPFTGRVCMCCTAQVMEIRDAIREDRCCQVCCNLHLGRTLCVRVGSRGCSAEAWRNITASTCRADDASIVCHSSSSFWRCLQLPPSANASLR